ncbi:MAG: shikimate kinase [Planctomycetota bacterium]
MNIILIGFRGTGKTTIGKILARQLGKGFIDADEYLEKKEGMSIKDIFEKGGEKLFRDIESKVIAELSLLDNKVIATGGGAVLRDENVKMLKKRGIIILLDADANTLHKRIRRDTLTLQRRPNLTTRGGYEEVQYLLEQRRPIYDKVADFVVNTAHISVANASQKIQTLIHQYVRD